MAIPFAVASRASLGLQMVRSGDMGNSGLESGTDRPDTARQDKGDALEGSWTNGTACRGDSGMEGRREHYGAVGSIWRVAQGNLQVD